MKVKVYYIPSQYLPQVNGMPKASLKTKKQLFLTLRRFMGSIKNDEYSRSELFSTDDRKIVIPDFQRDYCWGNKHYGEKKDSNIVEGFIDTLLEEQNKGKIILGKIDVYENPINHINLTDGQQRLTTIYLLIGMLARMAGNEKSFLKKCLISEFEQNDDNEPYLQYSIRESSVFFLRDLVNEFFIKDTSLKVKDIEKQPWHFNEYYLDPTIQSFKEALKTIEDKLIGKSTNEIDLFSKFVLNDLKVQYYDVEDRKHGEERFVIINTTGKGLTTTENIKPILLGTITNDRFAKEWEERETFFWKNRIIGKESTADKGVNDFIMWCLQIIEKQEDIDLVKLSKRILKDNVNEELLSEIDILFKGFQKFLKLIEIPKIQKQLQFITKENDHEKELKNTVDIRSISQNRIKDIILPLLSFISKVSSEEAEVEQFLRRIRKNYFDNLWTERKVNYVDWRHVLEIIEFSKTTDEILRYNTEQNKQKFKLIANVSLSVWFNIEEQLKLELKKQNKGLIEFWEDDIGFMGDISFLFQVFLKRKEGIPNNAISLNKEFANINLKLVDLEYLQTLNIERLNQCYDYYIKVLQNKYFKILSIRFNRQNHLWAGTWSLGREYFEYRRWHKKHIALIYQNWFYFVMGELLNDNVEMESLLKKYVRNIFSQSSKVFFETDLNFENEIDFNQFKFNLENKFNSMNNNGFYHWNGYLWYCLLAIHERKEIDFEIVFDLFDRKKDHSMIGNQFIWTKGYYDKSIKTHDNFENTGWNNWKNIKPEDEIGKENFIKNREGIIKSLFNTAIIN